MKNNIFRIGIILSFLCFYCASFTSCGTPSNSSSEAVQDTWDGHCYVGTLDPKRYLGSINDFYVDTIDGDVHIKVAQTEWEQITNLKDLPFVYENKWELHINYDGYFYVNEIPTTALVRDNIKSGLIDNTIELKDNKYFGTNSALAINNPVILMGNYQKNAKINQYNELLIEEVSTYVDKMGSLEIGTFNFTTKEYNRKAKVSVEEGLNNIKLDFAVPYGETLYFGGSETSVSLYVAKDIVGDDQNGIFTKNKDTLIVEEDRLILSVKAQKMAEISAFPNISKYENEDISAYGGISYEGAPIILKDYELFENKTITKFKFPIHRVSEISNSYTLTVSIIKQDYLSNRNFSENLIKEYPLDLTSYIGNIQSNLITKWVEVDVSSLNLTLKDGEMLGFGKNTDNVMICIDKTKYNNDYQEFNFYLPYYRNTLFNQNVFLDVYTMVTGTLVNQIENIKEIELKYLFADKNISIFGDSISSFLGYSNDPSKNATLANNAYHNRYDGKHELQVEQTWWMRLIEMTKANLLVNNSSAADSMAGQGLNRCVQLHSDDGVNPDIICMFFGINDVWRNGTLDKFKSNYQILIDKMTTRYPNADIYISTYIPYTWWSGTDNTTIYHKTENELELYNSFVRETVNKTENVYLVDLARDSGITFDNYKSYCLDEGNRWLHPNAAGMELIANTYFNSIIASKS